MPETLSSDIELDRSLRPVNFTEFIGQERLVENLRIFIQAARERGEALDHALFYGPPGLGKTTLAYVLAAELDVNIRCTSGPVLDKPGDLAGLLTNLQPRDVLFIDEIHRLPHTVEEYLYPAMEDFKLDIVIDQGPAARTIQLTLPQYTLIGATTRAGLLTAPLRSRFGVTGRLDFYTAEELAIILKQSAKKMKIDLKEDGADEISHRSRGTPRIANRLLRRIRDFAQVKGDGYIDRSMADQALKLLEVDGLGLDSMDIRILVSLIDKYRGGPVGLKTLAITVGEDAQTLEEVYEPFLIREGFLERTSKGRCATILAYEYLDRDRNAANNRQQSIL
ncbi:Holliday junction branch migration DNA helicase RuvB [bacterium]|nr:Holliday junction branch migration DNA helicase RuvB [bacterium]